MSIEQDTELELGASLGTLTDETYKDRDMSDQNAKKKKIKILKQAGNEIEAEIEDFPMEESKRGTPVRAEIFKKFHAAINQADSNAVKAKNVATTVRSELESLKAALAGEEGIAIQVNKQVSLGDSGVILVGRFAVDTSNITIDISSASEKAQTAKLILSCKDGVIKEKMIFDDANGDVAPKVFIKAPTSIDNNLDIYFKADKQSKNIFEIRAVDADIVFTGHVVDSIPSEANVTPTRIYDKHFDSVDTEITSIKARLTELEQKVTNMLNGTQTFTKVTANIVDLV